MAALGLGSVGASWPLAAARKSRRSSDAAARLFQRRAGVELRHLFEKLLAEPVPETWLAILEDRGEDDQIAL